MNQVQSNTRSIAFVGGKGGVGQTTIILNFAYLLNQHLKKKSLLLDAHFVTYELEALLGIKFKNTLDTDGRANLDINQYVYTNGAMNILPIDYNRERDKAPSIKQQYGIINAVSEIAPQYDYVLIDVPNCVNKGDYLIASAAEEIIFIVDDEKASLYGTHAQIMMFAKKYGFDQFNIIVNRVKTKTEGFAIFSKLETFCYSSSHEIWLNYCGSIYKDSLVVAARDKMQLAADVYPKTKFTQSCVSVLNEITRSENINFSKGNIEILPKFQPEIVRQASCS